MCVHMFVYVRDTPVVHALTLKLNPLIIPVSCCEATNVIFIQASLFLQDKKNNKSPELVFYRVLFEYKLNSKRDEFLFIHLLLS